MTTKNKTTKNEFNATSHKTDVISRLSLHVHNDIEDAAEWYRIPLAFWDKESVYVMQEDRCVFVGNSAAALQFITYNEGKYCKSKFPLNSL
jgi:hypothetical protein